MTISNSRLAKGQVWKTKAASIEIVTLGKRRIHYRVRHRLGLQGVSAQISGIEALENYLRLNQARLITDAARN
jgi:hypothetical protein